MSGRAYRGESADGRRRERRARLLAAGLALFGTQGYRATSVDAICAEAGLTKRYFYESFESGEALLAAVYEDVSDRLRARILGAVAKAAERRIEDPRRRALAMAEAGLGAFFATIEEDRPAARVLLFEILGVGPRLDAAYRDMTQRLVDVIRGALLTTTRAPRGASAELLAHGLSGAALQIAMRWQLSDYAEPRETVVRSCLAIYAAVVKGS